MWGDLQGFALGRRDILGAAETGSGKTLAFGLPILSGIMRLREAGIADKAGTDSEFSESEEEEVDEHGKPVGVF